MHMEIRCRLADPAALPELADVLVEMVCQIGDRAEVAYGEMCGHALHRPWTNLDLALRRDESDTMERSRRYLRGYEWVTVCPAVIAKSLGGAEALRASGAFVEVIALAAGGLLLRATRTPLEYDDTAVRRVFEALRPALPPGMPRHPQFETLPHLVMEDSVR